MRHISNLIVAIITITTTHVVEVPHCFSQVEESKQTPLNNRIYIPWMYARARPAIESCKDGRFLMTSEIGEMSLYLVDSNLNLIWKWKPLDPNMQMVKLFGIHLVDSHRVECLAANGYGTLEIVHYTVVDGIAVDSSIVNSSKQPQHVMRSFTTSGDYIGFMATVHSPTYDSLYAYIVDTLHAKTHVVAMPVSENIKGLSTAELRIVGSQVVVVWREDFPQFRTRIRMLQYDLVEESVIKQMQLADTTGVKYDLHSIVADTMRGIVSVSAAGLKIDTPCYGIQQWIISTTNDNIDSVFVLMPEYTLPKTFDTYLSVGEGTMFFGRLRSIDPYTSEVYSNSSRGFVLTVNESGGVFDFTSMLEERPTYFTSVYLHNDKILVACLDERSSQFVSTLDITTSIIDGIAAQHPQHEKLRNVGWYASNGEMIREPANGVFFEYYLCVHGCNHKRAVLCIDGELIGLGQSR